MGVQVGSCLHLSQPVVPHSPSSQTAPSAISLLEQRPKPSSSSSNRSSLFSTGSTSPTKLLRTRSYRTPKNGNRTSLTRACSASFSSFSDEDEEFTKKLEELSLRFEIEHSGESISKNDRPFMSRSKLDPAPPWLENRSESEPPVWPVEMTIPVDLEKRANSFELPLSLRIIKRKQWHERASSEGFTESAFCSVKKAFSSMVFMIRELQSYTLQIRQFLFYEDLQEILVRVQQEMQASFVWLFQQVFSCTPTLMVYVMILLANFTVYSTGNNMAFAGAGAVSAPESYIAAFEMVENRRTANPEFKDYSVLAGKFNVSGRGGGSDGKLPAVAGGADEDGQFDRSFEQHSTFFHNEGSPVSSFEKSAREEAAAAWEEEEKVVAGVNVVPKEELEIWNRIVEEASRMQGGTRDEILDHETMELFVSPVSIETEAEDYDERYFRTELLYQQAIEEDPENALFLSNYAQFLFLVVHDHDRAEEYFKRAVRVDPPDSESLSRYANFLWVARKDLTAAEETFLAAIEAEPGNTFHAASYAHFLWNSGGEDTCFPLDEA